MPKNDVIKEVEEYIKNNMPNQEIVYGEFISEHTSGQENYAIYVASEDLVIQENNYKDSNPNNRNEYTYNVHKEEELDK